jgi:phosphonate transport system ATP-binding protein
MNALAPVLKLKHVSQQFRQFSALSALNLQIAAGERVALVGSSGAGKSTLIQLLNGTLLPSTGEVWVFGRNLSQLSPRQLRQVQQQIGTIYQQFHLIDPLAVIHNVNAGHLGRWSLPKAALSLIYPLEVKTAAKALQRVGIPEKLYARTDQLSGGQQQRVALARVLVQDPLLILADEPVASLDPKLSHQIMTLLRALVEETGKTLVVSLHSIDLARRYCNRIIGLKQGRLLFDTSTETVSDAMIADLYQHQA